MKQNKLCVKQHDYEHYLIPLPMNALFGKKRKSYLISELEKMHPCFSDEFCFDTRLKFEKRKFFYEVVVINKMKLIEYRRKQKRYSSGVRFENLGNRQCFDDRKKYLKIILFFIVLLCTLFFLKFNHQRKNKVTTESKVPEQPIIIAPQKLPSVNEFCSKILDVIFQNDGKINNFEWKTDGYKESINCAMKKVFPEQFEDFLDINNFSEIKYVNDIPNVSFSGEQKLANENSIFRNNSEKIELYESIRKILFTAGAKIISENRIPYCISFYFSNGNEVLDNLSNLLKIYDSGISKVFLSCSDDNVFFMEMTLSPLFANSEGLDLSILNKNLGLFINEKASQKNLIECKNENFMEKEKKQNLQKFGEVIYANGRKTEFYKNEKKQTIKITEDNGAIK